jgi:hypothetical protein
VCSYEIDEGVKDKRMQIGKFLVNILRPSIFFSILAESSVYKGKFLYTSVEHSELTVKIGIAYTSLAYDRVQ